MKACVVYDSVYGNTEKIAEAIGGAIGGEVDVLRAGEVNPADLEKYDLLIIGTPTHGGRPTKAVGDLLDEVAGKGLRGINVAAFDTRMQGRFARIFGYPAPRIASKLAKSGGTLVGSQEGFYVEGKEGPLKEGELERAAGWGKEIAESME